MLLFRYTCCVLFIFDLIIDCSNVKWHHSLLQYDVFDNLFRSGQRRLDLHDNLCVYVSCDHVAGVTAVTRCGSWSNPGHLVILLILSTTHIQCVTKSLQQRYYIHKFAEMQTMHKSKLTFCYDIYIILLVKLFFSDYES